MQVSATAQCTAYGANVDAFEWTPTFTAEFPGAANWGLPSDFSIANMGVNVTGTRKAGGASGTDLSGWLKGAMTFDLVTVQAEAALPADLLSVTSPTLCRTSAVVCKNVAMTINAAGTTPAFSFTGTASTTTHLPSSPMQVAASGTISGSSFTLDGPQPPVPGQNLTPTATAYVTAGVLLLRL